MTFPTPRLRYFSFHAGVTQLVECNLAKVDVASSSLVTRSTLKPALRQKVGTRSFVDVLLAALSDDAQAVVVEVSEAVGAALDEFHLSVKTLGKVLEA